MPKVAQLQVGQRGAVQRTAQLPRVPRPDPHYFAFLSYSHKDEQLANWLHSELERFHVPATLAGRLSSNGVIPRRLTPIFRDRHELAAADDLGAEIRTALASSQFLIVLCSPAAAKSRWTNAEIDAFKRTRPDGCVFAAIIDGYPLATDKPGHEDEECFPPALRQKYDRRGRATGKRAEPIAADLRASGDGRRLGFLKLVAGMLGVGLDELVQRETTRRQRRLAWLAAGSLGGMVVTSTLAITAMQARDEARDQRRQAEGLVGFMLGDLRDKLEPIGRLDALDAVGSRALAYFEQQDKSQLTDEALAQRSRALTLMGEIAQTRGNVDDALKRYQEALASTGETLRRHPDDPQRLFDHAQNVFWIGYIDWQRGRSTAAADQFRIYKRLADRMVELAPNRKEYRLEQVYAASNLGIALLDERKFKQAVSAFLSCQGLAESLAAGDPQNADYKKQAMNNLAWLAEAHEHSGALDQALAERERQLRLIAELQATDPRDTVVQRDAMTARRAVGRLLASRGELAAALRESVTAVDLAEKLYVIEPENSEWLQLNAEARFDLANLQLATEQRSAAATARGGCEIVHRLANKNSAVADWNVRLRSRCLTLRARLALSQGAIDEALNLSRQAIAAAQSSPRPIERALLMSQSLAIGANALDKAGNNEASRQWRAGSLATVPRGIELRPSEMAQVASIRRALGNDREARRINDVLATMGYRYPGTIT
jgi:tetratricopeptide (TPR) repeat protein